MLLTIVGICRLCCSEHGPTILEVPSTTENQASPVHMPTPVSEPGASFSSLQEQSIEVRKLSHNPTCVNPL